jgi:hypothetical protein
VGQSALLLLINPNKSIFLLIIAMSDFNSVLNRVNNAISSKNSRSLALELSLPLNQSVDWKRFSIDHLRRIQISTYCQSNMIEPNLAMVFSNRTQALVSVADGNYEQGHML